jgi:hypothetical protein
MTRDEDKGTKAGLAALRIPFVILLALVIMGVVWWLAH